MKKTLGKYRLIAEIGRGGMATAYLAVMRGLGGVDKLVVIKRPREDTDADHRDLSKMFMNEARIAARLSHANIVQTHEVEMDGTTPYLVMEYLQGQALNRVRSRLREHPRAMPILLQAIAEGLDALHYLHEVCDFDGSPMNLIHRDVTPHNLFVTYEGHVKLMDFGIAKSSGTRGGTRTGVLKGKLKYMSPEQIANQTPDRRADIYAMGVILWETLARRSMFPGHNDAALLHNIASGKMPPIEEVVPDIAPALAAIARHSLAHDREARFANAADMQHAIEEYLETLPPRVVARDVGAVVSAAFAAERNEMTAVIQRHIADIRSTDDALPIIPSGMASLTPTTGGSVPAIEPAPPPLLPTEVNGSRRNGNWWLLVAVVAVSALASVIVVQLTREAPTPTAPAEAAVPQPQPASSVAEDAGTIELAIFVEPPDADVFVDDKLVSRGIYRGTLPKSGSVHRVRVEAPGYQSRIELVEATTDATVSIRLAMEEKTAAEEPRPHDQPHDRRGQAPPHPATPVPTPPGDPNTQAPEPTSDFIHKPVKPGKPIDTVNPYK